MLNDLSNTLCETVVFILALTTGIPVYLISTKGACDRSTEDAYSSAAPDRTFAFVGVRIALYSILYLIFGL
jgi:hypothetical protein